MRMCYCSNKKGSRQGREQLKSRGTQSKALTQAGRSMRGSPAGLCASAGCVPGSDPPSCPCGRCPAISPAAGQRSQCPLPCPAFLLTGAGRGGGSSLARGLPLSAVLLFFSSPLHRGVLEPLERLCRPVQADGPRAEAPGAARAPERRGALPGPGGARRLPAVLDAPGPGLRARLRYEVCAGALRSSVTFHLFIP